MGFSAGSCAGSLTSPDVDCSGRCGAGSFVGPVWDGMVDSYFGSFAGSGVNFSITCVELSAAGCADPGVPSRTDLLAGSGEGSCARLRALGSEGCSGSDCRSVVTSCCLNFSGGCCVIFSVIACDDSCKDARGLTYYGSCEDACEDSFTGSGGDFGRLLR